MIGVVTFFGLYAALYYWYPKMFGRLMNETLGKIHFWFTAAPVFAAFMGMHFIGLAGLLRRTYDGTVYEYARPVHGLNMWITAALLISAAAQVVFLVNFVGSWFRKERAPANPWEATTLEWTTPSPPPHLNWPEPPAVHRGPYEYRVNEDRDGFTPQHLPPDSPFEPDARLAEVTR
jgi:cytochrome c oxidase subunit 1